MKVIVTGMHRSGTSMMSMIMGMLGFHIGDFFSPEKPLDNPFGYFEDLDFKAVNRRIMRWNKCGPGSFRKLYHCRETPKIRIQIKEFLLKWKGIENPSWKDPRACLTIHIWSKFIPDLKVIYMTRLHIEIAHSLKRRNRIPLKRGMDLAKHYKREFMQSKDFLDWMPVAYAGFFEPGYCVEHLLSVVDFLGIPHPDLKTIEKIFSVVNEKHWHQRQGFNESDQEN